MGNDGTTVRSTAADAAERGLLEILTSRGFAEYLVFVAMLQDGVPQQFADRRWAYLSDRDAIRSSSWNAYRDRFAYCGMLGEWSAAQEFSSPQFIRQRLFGFDVSVLRVAPSARESRHIVNEIVRVEMHAMEKSVQDAELGGFLRASFFAMGHIMAGALDEDYFKQLAAAQHACSVSTDPNLHALLRRQSAFLWDTLAERSARTRRTTMRNILTEIDHMNI